jgi:NAD(P)-dependent dehydrogenase (short-subunit alcohol dehydrogenase family)
MKIQGSTFIITGGSSGLGAGCARRLAGRGANIILADINAHVGQKMAATLGGNVSFVPTDVTKEGDVQAVVDAAVGKYHAIHGVINCAGIAIAQRVLGREGVHTLADFSRVININLVGSFNMIRLAAEAMAENKPNEKGERGVIINTASVAAYDGQIGQAAYAASKGGIVSMTLPLAREFARLGIRVMTIAPGIFDTPMMAGLPEAARQSLAQQVPFPPRLGDPDDYAFLAEHIISNDMLNGEVIRLDGAIRMAAK